MNKEDFYDKVIDYALYNKISDEEARFKLNALLSKEIKKDQKINAIKTLILEYPELVTEYIKYKEENLDDFFKESEISLLNVTNTFSPGKIRQFETILNSYSQKSSYNSWKEANNLIDFFKQKIENEGVWKEFWLWNEVRIKEKNIQNLFKLTWRWSSFYVAPEVDRWSWPVDFIVTKWSSDTTLIEFKLASNQKALALKQVEQYKKSNQTNNALVVIFCFDSDEVQKISQKIKENNLNNTHKIIDVTPKISASKQ